MATISYEVYKILEEELGKEKKEQKPILKAEIKEELLKELVTKGEFYGEIRALRLELERRIDKVELLLKVLIGLVVVGLTLLNPSFVELVKTVFAMR
ncbi:MAG: hypothetical protein ABDH29_08045 [Aquificaceae bacterium]